MKFGTVAGAMIETASAVMIAAGAVSKGWDLEGNVAGKLPVTRAV
jgi:hypothetical protein